MISVTNPNAPVRCRRLNRGMWLDPVRDNFVRNLKRLMASKKLSKAKLGKAVGVTGTAVKMWLDGKTSPELARLDAIASALGTTYLELVKDTSTIKEIPVKAGDLETIIRELAEHVGLEVRPKN